MGEGGGEEGGEAGGERERARERARQRDLEIVLVAGVSVLEIGYRV
jgi:hypothetical protein